MSEEQWPPAHGRPTDFPDPENLQWGESSFDHLSRGELLRLAQAYHLALVAARGVMYMHRHHALYQNPDDAYWGQAGMGGLAMSKAEALLDAVNRHDSGESDYRTFYRYAEPLLFPEITHRMISKWHVNSEGKMVGDKPDADFVAMLRTTDDFRPIEWSDLLPTRE